MSGSPAFIAHPATADRWDDLVALFGPGGAFSGCWCTYWRVKRSEFDGKGAKWRRARLESWTKEERAPGLLFYDRSAKRGDPPFGWCSLGPREDFPVLARSPVLKPVDELPTWSIVCFFLAKAARGRGYFRKLVELAVSHARNEGAERIEVYPHEKHLVGPYAYQGNAVVYRSLGFEEVARRKPERPVLRKELMS